MPASAPDIAETLRPVLGWAWTYVIVAELIAIVRHRLHDHQLSGTDGHGPDHLRHHRDRRHRPDLDLLKYFNRWLFAWRFA